MLAPASLVGASISWLQLLACLRLVPTLVCSLLRDGRHQSGAVEPLLFHSQEQKAVVVVAAAAVVVVVVVEKWAMAAVVGLMEAVAVPQAVEPFVLPWRQSPYLWASLLHFDSPWH